MFIFLICFILLTMVQMGSNYLFLDTILYKYNQKTKDLTLFEPSPNHYPGIVLRIFLCITGLAELLKVYKPD